MKNLLTILGVLFVVVLAFLFAWPLQLLWNYVAPDFGLPELSYWKILCAYIFYRLFFGKISINNEKDNRKSNGFEINPSTKMGKYYVEDIDFIELPEETKIVFRLKGRQ